MGGLTDVTKRGWDKGQPKILKLYLYNCILYYILFV